MKRVRKININVPRRRELSTFVVLKKRTTKKRRENKKRRVIPVGRTD